MKTELLRDRIGKNIRELRRRATLTIDRLAELADIDSGFLAHLESGARTPSLETLVRIAECLRVEPAALLRDLPIFTKTADYKLSVEVQALIKDKTSAQAEDLLAVLKQLRDPEQVKGLRKFIRK